jgi:hypothetical protein
LLEIVSRPDLRSPLEARTYLSELKLLLTYLGVSDCNMQEGSLRVDANVNLHIDTPAGKVATPIVEVKNMNSFRAVERAMEYEAERHFEVWKETGQKLGDVPGLVGLTQTMAAQYGAQGIRTNLVAPGVIKTDMTREAWDAVPFQRLNHEMTPFNREGTPEDVANTIFFLASPEGSYINGQTIALDGGWSTTKYLCKEALLSERVPGTGTFPNA